MNILKLKILSLLILFAFTACKKNNTINSIETNTIYLDASQPVEKRVADLMSRMTLEEKVYQMNQYVGLAHMRRAKKRNPEGVAENDDAQGFYKEFSIEDVAEMASQGKIGSFLHVISAEEGNELQELAAQSKLKIPILIGIDAIHGNALVSGTTVYPSPITLAATWQNEVLYTVGKQTAKEMRATGSHWTFTPNIDVLRDPRWGRVGETFGEDPFMVGNMGAAMINGFQQRDFTGNEKVIACAKHMLGGGQPINGLNAAPFDVSERTIREVYLPPFKKAIDAGVFTIMAAHNEVNGIPAHMNKWLMTDLFRDDWGFNGFFISDWLDIERLATLHKVAEGIKEASYLSVDAGMDMHMHGPYFDKAIIESVKEGELSEDRINQACSKILEAKFRLGLFENRFVDLNKIDEAILTDEHKASALEFARKGIVLLKNDGLLPLQKTISKKTIFVTGPNANNQTILGDWHYKQPDQNVITIYEGIQKLGKEKGYKIDYFDSGDSIRNIEDSVIKKAAKQASKADYAVVVVGDNSMRYDWYEKTAGENMGRSQLNLAGKQLKLVQEIHKTGTPVIIVLVNGKPIAEPWLEENIPAIIETFEPGLFGGQALAEILFGDINPSGKLPLTVPRSVGQIQMIYNHKPSVGFHKYAFEKMTPLYPFGYGLSYTNYTYETPVLSKSTLNKGGEITISVKVANTGSMDGEEIVQLYIRDNISSVTRPVKELKGYQRVALKAGETKIVHFSINAQTLAFYDINMKYCVEAGDFTIMVGSSSKNEDLKTGTLNVPNRINLIYD